METTTIPDPKRLSSGATYSQYFYPDSDFTGIETVDLEKHAQQLTGHAEGFTQSLSLILLGVNGRVVTVYY